METIKYTIWLLKWAALLVLAPHLTVALITSSQRFTKATSQSFGKNEDQFYFTDEVEYENQKRLEEEEDLNVLTFEDLLCFAYQVAKGMEFLEFKSVSLLKKKLTITKDNFEKDVLFFLFNFYPLVLSPVEIIQNVIWLLANLYI